MMLNTCTVHVLLEDFVYTGLHVLYQPVTSYCRMRLVMSVNAAATDVAQVVCDNFPFASGGLLPTYHCCVMTGLSTENHHIL